MELRKKCEFKVEYKQLAVFSYLILLFWALINIALVPEFKTIIKLQNIIALPTLCLGILFIIDAFNNCGKIFFRGQVLFITGIVLASLILSMLGSYAQLVVTVRVYAVLGILLFYLRYKGSINQQKEKSIAELFYCFMLFVIMINIILYWGWDFNYNFYFPGLMDKNYTGVLVFLFLILSIKLRHLSGIFISIVYMVFMTDSRSFYGMLAIFFFIKIFRNTFVNIIGALNLKKAISHFVVLFLGIIVLSMFWISYVSINPLASYKEGLNDGSNKMRFVANVYALDRIRDNPQFIYKGLGDHIKEGLGIDSENYSQHTKVMGVRLVQPHNCFINMMLKIGVVQAVVYFLLLAYILDKMKSYNNIEFYFPYIINACFMHSLLDGPFLVIWTFILMISQERNNGVHMQL